MNVSVLRASWGGSDGRDHSVLLGVYASFLAAVDAGVTWRRGSTNPDTWFSIISTQVQRAGRREDATAGAQEPTKQPTAKQD